jgi:hypothetical protein
VQIEVNRKCSRATIITIDGKPYRLDEAAKELGLTARSLQKRLERGKPLDSPVRYPGEPYPRTVRNNHLAIRTIARREV